MISTRNSLIRGGIVNHYSSASNYPLLRETPPTTTPVEKNDPYFYPFFGLNFGGNGILKIISEFAASSAFS